MFSRKVSTSGKKLDGSENTSYVYSKVSQFHENYLAYLFRKHWNIIKNKFQGRDSGMFLVLFYYYFIMINLLKPWKIEMKARNSVQLRSGDTKTAVDKRWYWRESCEKLRSSFESDGSRVTTSFEPQYKITNFPSRLDGKGRVSLVLYLRYGIGDGNGQEKMTSNAVEQGIYLKTTLLWPAAS